MRPGVLSSVDRWMLPGELARLLQTAPARTVPTPRRTLRDWAVDAVLFLGGVAVWFGEFERSYVDNIYEVPELLRVADPVLGALVCLAVWWRRRFPFALGLFALSASAVSNTSWGALVVLLFSLALHRGWRQTTLAVLVSFPLGIPYIVLYFPNAGEDPRIILVFVVLMFGTVVAAGLAVRSRRQLITVLQVRADELRQDYERRLEDSRRDERRRIAREMHDTLAHRISLLTVHAGALEYRTEAAERGDAEPLSAAEVNAAVGVMRRAAHDAVDELREALMLLRASDESDAERCGTEPPQPDVDRLPALLAEAEAGGQRVDATIDGELSGLRAPVQRTVYRIVQEGLTNARKHAPDAAVDVTVRSGPCPVAGGAGVLVEIGNPVTPGVRHADGAGVGITGLSERVALHSGTLTHEIHDGRFVLRAEIPGGS